MSNFHMWIFMLVVIGSQLNILATGNIWDAVKSDYKDVTKYTWGHNKTVEADITFPDDDESKNKLKAQWDKYYDCIKEYHTTRKQLKITKARSIMAYEGEAVLFMCKLCIAPHSKTHVQWRYSKNAIHTEYIPLVYTRKMVLYDNGYLHLYHVTSDDVGLYQCSVDNTYANPIILEVVNEDREPLKSVRPKTAKKGDRAAHSTRLSEHRLVLYTSWSPWTLCSSCHTVGIRYRIGLCHIRLQAITRRARRKQNNFRKQLKRFVNGLPCRSDYLNDFIKDLAQVKDRKSEIMTALCERKCEDNSEIENGAGNVIVLKAINIGSFGRLKDIPNTLPVAGRDLIIANVGDTVKFKCPGHLLSEVTRRWRLGKTNPDILREEIFLETEDKLEVTTRQEIIIKDVQDEDTNIYSCWKLNELAGIVRLVVSSPVKYPFYRDIVTLLGAIIIILAFLLCLGRVCKTSRKLRTMRREKKDE